MATASPTHFQFEPISIARLRQSFLNDHEHVVRSSMATIARHLRAGNVLKSLPAGSELFTKAVYDSLGRTTTQHIGYDTAETDYSDAGSVTDNVILEQSETSYDAARNVLQTASRQRYHNTPAAQLGALGNPSTTPEARATCQAQWADALGRTVAAASYGINGGSTNTIRPTTLTYPNGRGLTFSYGAGSIGDRSSRIASIIDDDSTHLVDKDGVPTAQTGQEKF
ncbi:MAG TPA: hypothetical protein VL132_10285 [Planctomycetaceae bacterium]|nr:hypothetical protein [Planctomycetaceae bacterium]